MVVKFFIVKVLLYPVPSNTCNSHHVQQMRLKNIDRKRRKKEEKGREEERVAAAVVAKF